MRNLFVLLLLFAPLLGCDQNALIERFTPKQEAAFAKDVIARIAARDLAGLKPMLSSELRNPEVEGQLEKMANVVPSGKPRSIRTVGVNASTGESGTTYSLAFEYEFTGSWLVANVVLARNGDELLLKGIHFEPRSRSLASENALSFEGKGMLHYAFFALAIVIPFFIVYTLIVCMKTTVVKRKWLWLLFIVIGVVQFQLNWSTGEWGVIPVGFSLFGAGFFRAGPFAPYVFTIAMPLGAIVFLMRRKTLMQRASEASPNPPPGTGSVLE